MSEKIKFLIIANADNFNKELATVFHEAIDKHFPINYFVFTGSNAVALRHQIDKDLTNYFIYEEKKSFNELIKELTPVLQNKFKPTDIIHLTTANVYTPILASYRSATAVDYDNNYFVYNIYYDELENSWTTEIPDQIVGKYTHKCKLVEKDQYNKGKKYVSQVCNVAYYRLQELFNIPDLPPIFDINMISYYLENKLKLNPVKSKFSGITSLDRFNSKRQAKVKEQMRIRKEIYEKKRNGAKLLPRLEEAWGNKDLKGIALMFPREYPENKPERFLGNEYKWKTLITLLDRNKKTSLYLLGGYPWRSLNYDRLLKTYAIEEYRALLNNIEEMYVEILQHTDLVFGYQYGNSYFINLADKLGVPVYFYGHNVEKITEGKKKCVGVNKVGVEFDYIEAFNEIKNILNI